jgi:hypothetical protein
MENLRQAMAMSQAGTHLVTHRCKLQRCEECEGGGLAALGRLLTAISCSIDIWKGRNSI